MSEDPAGSSKGLEWLEGDEKLLKGIRKIFIKNVPPQMEKLSGALDAHDVPLVELLSHSIKGSAAMIGALPLKDAAYKVERAAMEGNLDEAVAHFGGMRAEFNKALASLTGTAL